MTSGLRAVIRFPAWFWTGLALRIACAPFLLQWFHPDERQTLEFAHGLAHGRMSSFLESELHLRNQTVPWVFSWLIRAADGLGFAHPWAWLTLIHSILAVVSWLGFWALVESFRVEFPKHDRIARGLGWFFALFWAGPMLYSRQLLEAISFPFAAFAWLAYRRRQPLIMGLGLGVSAFTRYPSALWAVGGFLLETIRAARERISTSAWFWSTGLLVGGGMIAVAIGGTADWATYGRWLESAPAYWAFNQPGGPVSKVFGSDSLAVYYRWFEFTFTPWLAPFAVSLGAYGLARRRDLLIFLLPYLAGHLWTPHREPRFMLPVAPFLVLAVAEVIASGALDRAWNKAHAWLRPVLVAHVALNFVWLPMHLWAQTQSAQGALILGYSDMMRESHAFISRDEPIIDSLLPPNTPVLSGSEGVSGETAWILADSSPSESCILVERGIPKWPAVVRSSFSRWFRIRTGHLWSCKPAKK